MSFDLNELRAQRERIREHLAWLEQQIARAEGQSSAPNPEPAPSASAAPQPVAAMATTAAASPPPASESAAPVESAPATVISGDYSPGGFDSSSRLGCIIAAIVAIGLILFLIFGLPELLYPDETETPAATETTTK